MNEETEALIQRWILAYCEMPVIVDPVLMRLILDGLDAKTLESGHDRKDLQGRRSRQPGAQPGQD
jgi:hypothetical protein